MNAQVDREKQEIAAREKALQYIAACFQYCQYPPLKTLTKLASEALKMLRKKRQAELLALLEQLRTELEVIRKWEQVCYLQNCDAVYESILLLTKYWPSNDPYVPEEKEELATAGLPSCPVCMEAITSQANRIVSTHPYQFHETCLRRSFTQRPGINHMNNNPFNSRDLQTMRGERRLPSFTLPETKSIFSLSLDEFIIGLKVLALYSLFGAIGLTLACLGAPAAAPFIAVWALGFASTLLVYLITKV